EDAAGVGREVGGVEDVDGRTIGDESVQHPQLFAGGFVSEVRGAEVPGRRAAAGGVICALPLDGRRRQLSLKDAGLREEKTESNDERPTLTRHQLASFPLPPGSGASM